MSRERLSLLLVLLTVGATTRPASADGVPIDGYLPLVGIGLTDEFDDGGDDFFMPQATVGTSNGNLLGLGSPYFDVALLDTGAALSLITEQAQTNFNLGGSYPNRSSGFLGINSLPIGGASGTADVLVNDALGLYAAGLQDRTSSGGTLVMNNATMNGQTNVSLATLPSESSLPNVLGLPFAGQYTTRISNSLPQVFDLAGQTVRTPSIDFHPLGSGGLGIQRTAQLFLAGETSSPAFFPNVFNIVESPYDDPLLPTVIEGGHFLNVNLQDDGQGFGSQFFFDTGASVTVVSSFKALELGFDTLLDDPEFTISILGSGGTLDDVPGFFVDQLTIPALGGSLTVQNVPVIVLDVTNVGNPNNIVDGIIGTNIFYGRDIVIDPNPSLGGGGNPPALYISDPVTTEFNWSTTAVTASWSTASHWSAAAVPDYLGVANLEPTGMADQTATVATTDAKAFEVNLRGGAGGSTMTLQLQSGAKLTTFTGTNIDDGGILSLDSAMLDTQFVDIRNGGKLTGTGAIATGSGNIAGQVENVSGVVAPEGILQIEGRYTSGDTAMLELELAGTTPGTGHGQLLIDGTAALGGTLHVTLDSSFDPAAGSQFVIVSTTDGIGGEFDDFQLPLQYRWGMTYSTTSAVLEVLGDNFLGDFNGDGIVDSADYTVWRDTLGLTGSGLAADANSDQVVDDDDYALWRSSFGNVLSTLVGNEATVPEPAAVWLAALLLPAIVWRRRARKRLCETTMGG